MILSDYSMKMPSGRISELSMNHFLLFLTPMWLRLFSLSGWWVCCGEQCHSVLCTQSVGCGRRHEESAGCLQASCGGSRVWSSVPDSPQSIRWETLSAILWWTVIANRRGGGEGSFWHSVSMYRPNLDRFDKTSPIWTTLDWSVSFFFLWVSTLAFLFSQSCSWTWPCFLNKYGVNQHRASILWRRVMPVLSLPLCVIIFLQ